jgi:HK97 gp10 family phage protein
MAREVTLSGFIAHLTAASLAVRNHQHEALEKAARVVEAEAKREIGHYQGEAGQFAPWAELADSTKADRVRQGYAENEPLLRDGTLRDSIGHVVRGNEAVIGSASEIAVYQELGTDKIPPRSFLGGALVRKSDQVAQILGEGVVKALVGPGVFQGRLPIND